eukprot:5515959-Pleurochrysis_carterae.AAC.2
MMLRMARSATPFNWCTCGGHELARVVTVKRSDDSGRAIAAVAVQKRREGRDEGAYGGGRITFGAQQVDCLEPRMVVH